MKDGKGCEMDKKGYDAAEALEIGPPKAGSYPEGGRFGSRQGVVFKIRRPYKITFFKDAKSPFLYAYWVYEGVRYRISTGKDDITPAIAYATEKYLEIKNQSQNPAPKLPNFNSILNDFLKEKSKYLKPKSLENYIFFSKMLGEYFKNIENITPQSLSEYDEWRRGKIKGDFKGEVVINREITLLKNILRWASNFYQVRINIPKVKPYPEDKRIDIPTPQEMDMILDWFCGNGQIFHYQLISFLIETGIRAPSEYQKLMWKDVDIIRKTITIRDRKSRHKDDTIPISSKALEILKYYDTRKNGNPYVFSRDGYEKPSIIKYAWNTAIKNLGLNKKYTLYSTRHFFASRMIMKGIPLKVIATLMGHSTTKMVETTYAHLLCDDLRKFID